MTLIPRKPSMVGRRLARPLWKLVLGSMGRVEPLSAKVNGQGFAELRNLIRASGTDSLSHFANEYEREGGLCLQQNPDEFAALCLFLRAHKPIANYLEIGSASGGTCRFLSQQVGMEHVYILDDGQHPRYSEQDGNLAVVKNVVRFIGDSHSPAARQFLAANVSTAIDVAFIDGDHSYEGVWADLRLAMAFAHPGTLVIFHDTVACDGVERAWIESTSRGLLSPLAEYIGSTHPLGIAIGAVR